MVSVMEWCQGAPAEAGEVLWMEVPYGEGVASHTGPESCVAAREGVGEALTGVRAGQPLSLENLIVRGADVVLTGGRQHPGRRDRQTLPDPAWSNTLRTYALKHLTREGQPSLSEAGRSRGRPEGQKPGSAP